MVCKSIVLNGFFLPLIYVKYAKFLDTSFISITGLFLECPGITSMLLRNNLQHIHSPIQSLSIYDFDRTVTTLGNDLFASSPSGIQIKHLGFSNSNIQSLKESSLTSLRESLESLSIVNGKLTHVSMEISLVTCYLMRL
jgi:hypothetical protein